MTVEPTAPPPRANPDLIGHEATETLLRQNFEAGRLPHALLISGPRGIGKATLAFRLAQGPIALESLDAAIKTPRADFKTIPAQTTLRSHVAAALKNGPRRMKRRGKN